MKGRKPKPTNLKILEGNPGQRPLPKSEPKPQPIAPKPPKWLRKEAKKEWKRAAKELEQLGLLTQIDMAVFAGYCQTYAKWQEAEEFMQENGSSYPIPKYDKEGEQIGVYWQQYPQVSQARQYLDQINKIAAEFGMTASSRGRIQVPGQKDEEDEMETLLNKKSHK